MARKTIEERIAELDARRKALMARATKAERARDTRRKVLLGAWLLQEIEDVADPQGQKRAHLARSLDRFLTRPRDRELFADILPLRPTPPAPQPAAEGAPGERGLHDQPGGKLRG